ncbi:MAG: SRPBCC family protein [Gaiellaceae bacterium]
MIPAVGAEYQFLSTWPVPGATIEELYDVIGDTLGYPRWWGAVFLHVEGDEGPPRPGRRARVKARGFLPYRIRWGAEITEAERPRLIRMRLFGDFEGQGEWRLEQVGDEARATLDWRPFVEKPLVRYLTPVLRPLFAKNHYWAMDRGRRSVAEEVQRRRSEQPLETRL